jgi:hypothetical protein
LPVQAQDRLAQLRNEKGLTQHDHRGHHAQPDVLHHDERQGRQCLAAEEGRRDEGVADEAAERLDLVLDHGRDLGLLDLAHLQDGEAQDPVAQFVAQAAQHALAHASLSRIDDELEAAVDDDQDEEREAERQQQGLLLHHEAVEQSDRLAGQHLAERQVDGQERLDRARTEITVAHDSQVDDALRHVEGDEIERHRQEHQQQDRDLLPLRVAPDIFEDVRFHTVQRPVAASGTKRVPKRGGKDLNSSRRGGK